MGKNKKAQRQKKKKEAEGEHKQPQNNGPVMSPSALLAHTHQQQMLQKQEHKMHVESVERDPSKVKGDAHFRAREYDKAIDAYKEALTRVKHGQEYVSINSNMAAVYIIESAFEKAVECAERCVKSDPTWPKGHIRLGEAYYRMCFFDESLAAFERAAALSNDDVVSGWLTRLQKVQKQLAQGRDTLMKTADGANPDADKFTRMIEWLEEAGSKFPLLYMKYYSADSRGVHALADIPDNMRIMYIPHSRIMTSEKAKASAVGRQLVMNKVNLRSQHSYLAAYLCQEKAKPDSEWRPYLDILPSKYANVPIFFTDDELNELEGSFILPKIHDRKAALKAEYDLICSVVPDFHTYASHWDFVWARLVVITRIFGLMIKGHKTDGLVPYADMLNHKIPRVTKWTFTDECQGFTITSTTDMSQGGEVFDSYGRKCNSRFFVNYGFAVEDNEDNEAVIKVAIRRDDPHYDLKIRLLGGEWYHGNREFQMPAAYTKKTWECFSFLRLVHATTVEEIASLQDGSKIDSIPPMTVRCETAVLKQLRQAASIVLSAFPTTIEQDTELLKQHSEYSNMRNILVMRLGEKKVLQWMIDLANLGISYLEMPWKDLKKLIERNHAHRKSSIDVYVLDVIRNLKKSSR